MHIWYIRAHIPGFVKENKIEISLKCLILQGFEMVLLRKKASCSTTYGSTNTPVALYVVLFKEFSLLQWDFRYSKTNPLVIGISFK